MILIVLMAAAGLAGCVGDEDEETTDSGSTMDASDGGYTYCLLYTSPSPRDFG